MKVNIPQFLTLSIIMEASVMSGASQQPADSDFMKELIVAVAETIEAPGVDDETYADENVLGVLSEISSLGVLDYIGSVYDSVDFYESGAWGTDGATYHSDVFQGTLPQYALEDFIRPVVGGKLTSKYGYRNSFRRLHKGIDISLEIGDPVRAALPGVVARIGYEPKGYGHFVILVHSNGTETRYAHLSSVAVTEGQSVAAGEDIALGGNSGNSTGPHLHFEVRRHGKAIDPLHLFSELEDPMPDNPNQALPQIAKHQKTKGNRK